VPSATACFPTRRSTSRPCAASLAEDLVLRALWITTAIGSPAGIRPDIELARGLANAGVAIQVIAPEDSAVATGAQEAGLEYVGPLPRGWIGRRLARWLREGCLGSGTELVHLFDRPAAIATLPALRRLPLAVVMRLERPGGLQRWNPLARLSVLDPRIDCVICPADSIRTELAGRRDAAGVFTIRPGHSPAWHAGPAVDLRQFGVPPEAFPVAVLSNYRPRKGIEYIVDAAQWLPADAPVYFLLIGEGVENRGVLERIVRSPFRRRFRVLGFREDAPGIVAACKVAMRGAVAHEGIPRSLLESMACAVPPIATNSPSLRELIIQGESGILVRRRSPRALGEALAWLLEHPEQRRSMGQAARERILGEFTPERALAAHLEIYRALCRGRSIMRAPGRPGEPHRP
jgi:L-malate glycosyltransferase